MKMFKLKKEVLGIRSGEISSSKGVVNTPCFFITNNFGGGGTNVSRLFAYSDLITDMKAQLLLNYYYLDINSDLSPRFDTELVRKFATMADILDFIQYVKNDYLSSNPRKAINNFPLTKVKWAPLTLLDSGSGNILRNKIREKHISRKNYSQIYSSIVKDFFDFIINHKFDIGIAMDFAAKNTFKDEETKDKNYLKELKFFTSKNFELLDDNLKQLKKYKSLNLYAPVHGQSIKEYLIYLNDIIKLEKKEKTLFAGFAIGGLGNPRTINGNEWNIPSEVNARVKGSLYLYNLVSAIRTRLKELKDTRPIHILGAASPYNLIPLLLAGADTFDCHSAWRRASDGNDASKSIVLESLEEIPENISTDASFSKLLVPLLNSNNQFIQKNAQYFLEFVEIYKLNQSNFYCNCPICAKYSLDKIKKLYSGNTEENYFAKILIYLHSIYQYQAISEKLSGMNSKEEFIAFIKSAPKSDFKEDIEKFLSIII